MARILLRVAKFDIFPIFIGEILGKMLWSIPNRLLRWIVIFLGCGSNFDWCFIGGYFGIELVFSGVVGVILLEGLGLFYLGFGVFPK